MSVSAHFGPRAPRQGRLREAGMRVLRTLVATGPTTLAELADVLGGHPNTTRVQLSQLVAEGLATETPRHRPRRGRPAWTFEATLEGQQVAGLDAELLNPYDLLRAISQYATSGTDPRTTARAIGRAWGGQLAEKLADLPPEERLLAVLAAHGFAPSRATDGIELRVCPLQDAERCCSPVLCAVQQGVMDAVSPEPIEVIPFARDGICLVTTH